MTRSDIHRHARQIADSELGRCQPLRALPAEEALLVAAAVREAAAAVADCLLEEAQADPRLRAALETIYGTERSALARPGRRRPFQRVARVSAKPLA
jgi:hypothetical protein